MNFHQTILLHLESIQKKDFLSFAQTISSSKDISLIMPTGQLITGYKDVLAMNKAWFEDPDWSFDFTLIKEEETSELGYALAKIDYSDIDPEGHPYNKIYYLSLIFRKTNKRWLLVHDQNTFQD